MTDFDPKPLMDRVEKALKAKRQAAERALADEAELILGEAIRIVPIEEGVLQDSGRTAVSGLTAAIGFGAGAAAPYAVRQHEDTTLRHDAGRQAKYLEQPLMAARATALRNIAKKMEKA